MFNNMDDNKWMALSGFGQALGALDQGRAADMSPTMALIARNKDREAQKKALSESGVLDSMPPEMRAVVAQMEPGMAQRTILQHMQRMQAMEAERNDPYRLAQMENLRLRNAQLAQPSGAGPTEYGLSPQYGVDADGNPVMLQVGRDGTAIETDMPDGVTLSREPIRIDAGTEILLLNPITQELIGSIPKNLSEAESQKAAGRIEGTAAAEASVAAPQTMQQADSIISAITSIVDDPNLDGVTGKWAGRFDPGGMAGAVMYNQEEINLLTRMENLGGKAFLQAFETLKGGGQITEREGQAAQAAIANLNRLQGSEHYRNSLNDLFIIANNAKLRAQGKQVPEYVPRANPAESNINRAGTAPNYAEPDFNRAERSINSAVPDFSSMTDEELEAWIAQNGG